ncbi:DUF6119 family protein [Tabrizicola sp.]|uniref:DUF6119 family protein n=1 Tax=Tabrizicola sp. TaxID=2005166 RepID=UPI0025D81A83|nr:DUF6119 family protein [Tabrizicola sp.]
MPQELAKVTFYLAKAGRKFDDLLSDPAEVIEDGQEKEKDRKVRTFDLGEVPVMVVCQLNRVVQTPPWIDFINERIGLPEDRIAFSVNSVRPSGVILIELEGRVLAATFGTGGRSLLKFSEFVPDFGIKTAMNMCGNQDLRQTKTRTHALTTKQIDRQVSRPSDSLDFGMTETEILKYISAHAELDKNVTLQGKDSLTVKVIGDEKLSWDRLVEWSEIFLQKYKEDRYKQLFPNYPAFEPVPSEIVDILDQILVDKIKSGDLTRLHLAVPEFLPDDDFSFSYSNHASKNIVVSHVVASDLLSQKHFPTDKLSVAKLKAKQIYAYSHEQDKILGDRCWSTYSCIVTEVDHAGACYVLSEGVWQKVDDDFYKAVNNFIAKVLPVEKVDKKFHGIDISVVKERKNKESRFNERFAELCDKSIMFDRAKLKIGQGRKDKEFCDLLQLCDDGRINIIQVKQHSGSSNLSYLFSQARFYCDFFLSDQVFLDEIRDFIKNSKHGKVDSFLAKIGEKIADVNGGSFVVKLWTLYNEKEAPPAPVDLPLMAKYELKLAYERLRNINKYANVCYSTIPVKIVNFQLDRGGGKKKAA